jgi:transposase-like protein
MHVSCPHCIKKSDYVFDVRTIVRFGIYHRTSDSKTVKRYRCKLCRKTFSQATVEVCFRQKKRQKNNQILELLASGVSQRRTARLLRLQRKTVARRLVFLGRICLEKLRMETALTKVTEVQFDDLETFEHTKLKPVSILLVVVGGTRQILGFGVASMGPKGLLAARSIKKFGRRNDDRSKVRKRIFREICPSMAPSAIIKSDSNPYYIHDVKKYFPGRQHWTCLGQRGAITGQGELKKIKYDPIFSLNHTCAMLRANIARLIRKTWCTTKKRERLADHLAIYAYYHNRELKKAAKVPPILPNYTFKSTG